MNLKNDNLTTLFSCGSWSYMSNGLVYGDYPSSPSFAWRVDDGILEIKSIGIPSKWQDDTIVAQVAYNDWLERELARMIVE